MLKDYYQLTKPGIIYGNLITATAGFFLASNGLLNIWLLVSMLIGLALVMAGGCVFNNYLDYDLDLKMERTKERAQILDRISKQTLFIYGAILLILGFVILFIFTNLLTVGIALLGVLFYLGLYTPLKRFTVHSTLIGSIAGATPPLIGYCAVSNNFNLEAVLIFLLFVFWQLPHFFAIALYRLSDYTTAGLPVVPTRRSLLITKLQILGYIIAFACTALLFTLLSFTSVSFVATMMVISLVWLFYGLYGLQTTTDIRRWSRLMFFISLAAIMLFSIMAVWGGK
jgi:protoheme IX farnesyltransferase